MLACLQCRLHAGDTAVSDGALLLVFKEDVEDVGLVLETLCVFQKLH